MDAVKFLKEKKRMCDLHTHAIGCDFCPLSMHNNETGEKCKYYIFNNPQEAVSIVEKWSKEHPKEHPAETRQSKFLKAYPNANMVEGVLFFCPRTIDLNCLSEKECRETICSECREKYWLAEVE